jgi:hypothetical protein
MASLNVHVTAVVTSIAVAPLAGEVDTIDGNVVSGFSATCLLLHDMIAKADRRNTSDTTNRFFIINPSLSMIYHDPGKHKYLLLDYGI